MTRDEWISYYESIHGHKPSVLEVAQAEQNGEIFVLSSSSSDVAVLDADDYTSYNTSYKRTGWQKVGAGLAFIGQVLWGAIKVLFFVARCALSVAFWAVGFVFNIVMLFLSFVFAFARFY